MKRRWKLLLALAGASAIAAAAPVLYIEIACRPMVDTIAPPPPSLLPLADRRPLARTWLTYPEWHIVYAADSYGRYLTAGRRPSGYPFLSDIRSFWRGYCALNRVAGADGGDAKVMLATIGLSFSAEMLVKAAYENSLGRLTEGLSGWISADDRYAAQVQTRYGAFMHQTPWYAFPFGAALMGAWHTREPQLWLRHVERRAAVTGEYGVKAGYAALIGWASGTALGRDELSLRFVGRFDRPPAAIDPRLRVVARHGDVWVVEAPRYAVFTQLLETLAGTATQLVEIAGNRTIFVTMLVPDALRRQPGETLSMPLADRPGWRRVGVTVPVPALLPMLRRAAAEGAEIEHVYDY